MKIASSTLPRSPFAKMVTNLSGTAFLRIIGMMLAFLVGVQLARYMGVANYGTYGLAMSILALVSVPIEFGLPQLITREVASARVNQDWPALVGILAWSWKVVFVSSFFVAIAVMVWWVATKEANGSVLGFTLMMGLAMVPFVAIGNINGAALRGLNFVLVGQLPDTIIRPAVFSCLLFVASLSFGVVGPTLAMGLGAGAALIAVIAGGVILFNKLPLSVRSVPPVTNGTRWLQSAWPMALTEGMRFLQGNISILVLGVVSTVTMVGLFRSASAISMIISFPMTIVAIVISPLIANYHASNDRSLLQSALAAGAAITLGGTVLATLPFVFAGHFLISFLFGAEFGEANSPLLFLCGGYIGAAYFGACGNALAMCGHEVVVAKRGLQALLLLATIIIPASSYFDAVGAAAASSLVLILWNYAMWRDARRLLDLDTSALSIRGALSAWFKRDR